MSTRSVTVIHQTYDDVAVALYRHCDGYPAVAGAGLATALSGNATPETAVARLLGITYDATDYRPVEHAYHFHNGPETQGDLEHVYIARHNHTDGWNVTHYQRQGWSEGSDEYSHWPSTTFTLADFITLVVNPDRQETNERLAELRAKHPGIYADAKGYEMLEVPR